MTNLRKSLAALLILGGFAGAATKEATAAFFTIGELSPDVALCGFGFVEERCGGAAPLGKSGE